MQTSPAPEFGFSFWIKAWLIAALVGPALFFGIILIMSIGDSGLSLNEVYELLVPLFFIYMVGLPLGGAMALIWALVSWGLSRWIGRGVLAPSVLVGFAVPVIALVLMNGAERSRTDRESLLVFSLTGGLSALVGIGVISRSGRAAPPQTPEPPHD